MKHQLIELGLLLGIGINLVIAAWPVDVPCPEKNTLLPQVEVIDTITLSKAQKDALKRGLKYLDSILNTPENRYKRYKQDSIKKERMIRSWQQFTQKQNSTFGTMQNGC